jgi:hypothetical protein
MTIVKMRSNNNALPELSAEAIVYSHLGYSPALL